MTRVNCLLKLCQNHERSSSPAHLQAESVESFIGLWGPSPQVSCPKNEFVEPFIYTHDDNVDVVMEDEHTIIDGETPLDDDEKEAGDIPVRLLDDFVIYDIESLEAVPLAILMELEYSPRKFSASGLVKPWVEQDSDDEEEEEGDSGTEDNKSRIQLQPVWERLSLNPIIELVIHIPGNRKGELDEFVVLIFCFVAEPQFLAGRKIYIKTEFAWYILGAPSRQYRTFVRPFWIKHRLLHLLVSAANKNARLTFEEFK